MRYVRVALVFFGFIVSFYAVSQRCYTQEGDSILGNSKERKIDFENWMLTKKVERKTLIGARTEAPILQIPVVFHVIHNGEALGVGTNIADEQILSQLQVLNEDFRRTNLDASNTPAEFLPVASDTEIEFVMARQDPEGLPTDGIVRVQGTQSQWKWSEQSVMKSMSRWPTDRYMNIWVADLTGEQPSQSLLGYAQYPVQSTLPGLDFATDNADFDGVASDYTVTGSIALYPEGTYHSTYFLGRTLTHEVGHFLGLRHIWGDESVCEATDYCDDTPPQLGDTIGCPTEKITCDTASMFQNYMDYTADECMNLFTEDQKIRMRIVLENSPRRLSLTTSIALQNPIIYDFDAGITAITNLNEIACSGLNTPVIEVKNYGNVPLTSVEIALFVNNSLTETKTFNSDLGYLEAGWFQFSALNFTSGDNLDLRFEILSVNGTNDQRQINNVKNTSLSVQFNAVSQINETFEVFPSNWDVINKDNSLTWEIANAPYVTASNNAISMNYYNYDGLGEIDWLLSPVFDLAGETNAFLNFDVSYASYPGYAGEALLVAVIQNCNASLDALDTLYYKTSEDLRTASDTYNNYVPSSSLDWRTEEFINLAPYINSGQIQLAFIARNGYGNNLYLDNVLINTGNENDIGITKMISPGFLSCDSQQPLVIEVKNLGTQTITEFTLNYQLDGNPFNPFAISGITLEPGITMEITLPFSSLLTGTHTVEVTAGNPNNSNDTNPLNNSITRTFEIDNQVEKIPFRETFDTSEQLWKPFSSNTLNSWLLSTVQENSFATAPYYNYQLLGQEDWLISPLIDFNNFEKASFFMDVAYSSIPNKADQVYVMLSENCGTSYNTILYQKSGDNLSTTSQSIDDFTPTREREWQKEFMRLTNHTGSDQVRLAIVTINGSGNNIHFDNLEFFADDDPTPVAIAPGVSGAYPNPTSNKRFKLTFNLPEHETVMVNIYNAQGKMMHTKKLNYVLNQTFEFYLRDAQSGIYFINIVSKSINGTNRIMLK